MCYQHRNLLPSKFHIKLKAMNIYLIITIILYLKTIVNTQSNDISSYDRYSYNLIKQDPKYLVLASKTIRPGQIYKVIATVYRSYSINVRVSLLRDEVELASANQDCKSDIPETLLLRVPPTSSIGNYKLRVEGNQIGVLGGRVFLNETVLNFSQRSMTIFIATDKPIYMQNQIVKFRCTPITTDLKAFGDSVDIFMLDPKGNIMKRWLSRQSNLGAISLEYPLSDQPIFGNWTIKVIVQGQEENKQFLVEEFYQTRFEVNVSMPTFFLSTDEYIHGSVMANFTSGIPVAGNLTLLVTVESSKPYRTSNQYDQKAIERPFKSFNGYTKFHFEISSLLKLIGGNDLGGAKVTVHAYVGERFLNLIHSGYSRTYIFNSKIKLRPLGSSPQVFKPSMPVKAYFAISHHDGSVIPDSALVNRRLNITPIVYYSDRQALTLKQRTVHLSSFYRGIWEVNFDLKEEVNDLGTVNRLQRLRLEANYIDTKQSMLASAFIDYYPSYAPSNRMIQVTTSSYYPKVGEYIIFHVRANYYVTLFSYVVIAKGIILMAGREEMLSTVKTFALTLSPEMAPSSTIFIYDIVHGGEMITDALTFSVNGIARNNFTVTVNNRKDKTGENIEIGVFGQAGTYVGLSAMDKDLYSLNLLNQISYADILQKMFTFDEEQKASLTHIFTSKDGNLERFIHFPSPTYGIDSKKTLEYLGLIVYTDANITERSNMCNGTVGYKQCLDGLKCYHKSKECDQQKDCIDGSDETHCNEKDPYNLSQFRIYRSNRLQRLFDNSWLWRDVYIGSKGYFIFNVPVPKTPATWIITAFGMNNAQGFGIQRTKLYYNSVRPFTMNVEMPSKCIIGEQIGIRVSLFNNIGHEIEVAVVLMKSVDYKFVQVGRNGIVSAQYPDTFFGEHHHLVLIRPYKSRIVYIPIVAQRLGDINVTIVSRTQIAKNIVTKSLHVDANGIPQILHSSVVIDLSQGAYVIKYLDTNITDSPVIPFRNEHRYLFGSNRARVSLVGDFVGPVFPFMPVTANNLLKKPSHCGEQNMFDFAFNLYTLFYLRLSGQRRPDLQKTAFKYLNIQYQKQISYQNEDGSFKAFRWNGKPSVWLTAFCARILSKATLQEWENFLYIDHDVISKAVSWILKHQTPQGSFYETVINTYDRKMNLSSKLAGDYSQYRNISLTAHVLITLHDIKNLPGEIGAKAATARNSAQKYLERMLTTISKIRDPYELAIVSYALTLVNSVVAEEASSLLFKEMREINGLRYWGIEPVPPIKTQIENNRPYILPRSPNMYESLNVETTAYALLVHSAKQTYIQKEIVDWLNTYRLHTGGWSSTQDSIIAYQALIEYSIGSRIRDVTDISVTMEIPSLKNPEVRMKIGKNNVAELQEVEIPFAYGPIVVKAQGSGVAILQLDVQYNIELPQLQIPPPLKSFELNVIYRTSGRNSSVIAFRSCQRWILLNESLTSGMAVLELTIPSGYHIQQQELDTYVKSKIVRNLEEAKFSERKVVFYFNYLDNEFTCVNINVQRWYPVANLTRFIPARVYDYYAPERFNETIIDVYNLYLLSICHVCGSYQCPYCPIYSGTNIYKPNINIIILSILISTFLFKMINDQK